MSLIIGAPCSHRSRVVRKFQTKDASVGKLFAKHIKIADAIKFLNNNRTGMAVGTPTRLNDLLENGLSLLLHVNSLSLIFLLGALAIDRLERIVVDASHIDVKKRGVLEMKETQVPLINWLVRKELKERYGADANGIELLFY